MAVAACGDGEVIDDARPEVVAEVELGVVGTAGRVGPRDLVQSRRSLGGEQVQRFHACRRDQRLPGIADGHATACEGRQQPRHIHVQRGWVGVALEAVGRHGMRAAHIEPLLRMLHGQAQHGGDDLAEHGPEVGAGILGVVDLGAQARLAHGEATSDGLGRHPDVDAELGDVRRPVVLVEVVPDEVAADAEVAADGLADTQAVQGPGERIRDGVGDGAVVLVALVERGDVVEAAFQDGSGQQLDPFGHDRAQVGVNDHQRLDVQGLGDLEDRPQRGALAADTVDLRVGQRQSLQAVARTDQQDALDIVGWLRLDDDAAGAVG